MTWIAGPILYFRGATDARLDLDALLVVRSEAPPPELVPEPGEPIAPALLHENGADRVWRYRFSVPTGGPARYRIGEQVWPLYPPTEPLRVAFTACNGDSENDLADLDTLERNERWRHLLTAHEREPCHLLLQGGDQLYADDLWRVVAPLRSWQHLPRDEKFVYEPDQATRAAVERFYFDRYCELWGQRDVAPVLARIPSLMMWDDHDIVDGWGSHDDDWQQSPVARMVWDAARRHFALFQLGSHPDDLPAGFATPNGEHLGWAYRVGNIGLIAPDLRSDRTRRRVLSPAARDWFHSALDDFADCGHVLLISSVPLINLDLSLVERVLESLPGQPGYRDDLRDQWRSYAHREEWQALVRHLLDWSKRTQVPITAVSGEIHLTAHGCIRRGDTRIHQLISAGVAHDPPPDWLARLYDWWARKPETIGPDTELRMLPLPEFGRRYLSSKGWLALDFQHDGELHATWQPDRFEGGLALAPIGRTSGNEGRKRDSSDS